MTRQRSILVLAGAAVVIAGAGAQTAFLPVGPLAPAGSAPFDLLAAHLDSDGRADIVLPMPGPAPAFGVLLSTGPLAWTPVAGSIWADRIFAAGDVNGDGRTDLVARLSYAPVTLLGDGAGRFHPPIASQVPGLPAFVTLADLDNDGRLDALGSFWTSNSAGELYHFGRGTGSGTFSPWPLPLAGVGPAGRLSVLDRDADGDLDVLWAGQATTVFLDGDGQGNLVVSAPIVLVPPVTVFALAHDMNGDGLGDIVYTTSPATVAIARGLPGGAFTPPVLHLLPPGFQTTGVIRAADLDGDSRPDLIIGGLPTISTQRPLVMFGTPAGLGPPGPLAAQMANLGFPESFAVLDLDQDADPDVLYLSNVAGIPTVRSLLNLWGGGPTGVSAPYGAGCPSGSAVLDLVGAPVLGQAVQIRVDGGAPSGNGLLVAGSVPAVATVGSGCFLGVNPAPPAILFPHALDGSGQVLIPTVIPSIPALQGTRWWLQEWITDPLLPWWYTATNGLLVVIG